MSPVYTITYRLDVESIS